VFHPPEYRHTPLASYPPGAREQGLSGAGLFEVRVMKDGRVGEVKVRQSTGVPVLDEAAERTIKTWTFEQSHCIPTSIPSELPRIAVSGRVLGQDEIDAAIQTTSTSKVRRVDFGDCGPPNNRNLAPHTDDRDHRLRCYPTRLLY
jgi:TonB family protein